MTKNHASGWLEPDPAPLGLEEAAFDRSPFHDDVERLLGTLNACLPSYESRLGGEAFTLIRDNLQVLTECFYGEPLTSGAVEVIYLHLDTLSRMLTVRLN